MLSHPDLVLRQSFSATFERATNAHLHTAGTGVRPDIELSETVGLTRASAEV